MSHQPLPPSRPAQPQEREAAQRIEVPAYSGTLAPPEPARIRQLRRNLLESMRDARALRRPAKLSAAPAPEPAGFTGELARAACALCQGWCCSKGGEHAYLDGPSMARIRRARPEWDAWAILRVYTHAVANPGYAGSCMFHGTQGCTLDRDLRADLCNRYFCNGLDALVKRATPPTRAVVVASRSAVTRSAAFPAIEAEDHAGE